MIYLIESSGYNRTSDNKVEYFQLLKIGYTDDKGKDRRYSQYKLHNPTCKVLSEIPLGTEDHEFRIQYKFKDLQYEEYGREWFKYSEEIIDFFKNIKSLEDIENNLPKDVRCKHKFIKRKKEIKRIIKYIYPVDPKEDIIKVNKDIIKYFNKLIDNLGDKIKDIDNVLNYLKKDFGESRVNKFLEDEKIRSSGNFTEDSDLNQEIKVLLNEYLSYTDMRDKYKLLCERGLSKDIINKLLSQISDSDIVKSNYISLGPDRLRALGYRKSGIQKELNVAVFDSSLLQDRIYQEFKEGDKITLSDVKSRLASIYFGLSYQKSPKAMDILNYFEVKEVSFYEKNPDGSRKRIRGYELLKKK